MLNHVKYFPLFKAVVLSIVTYTYDLTKLLVYFGWQITYWSSGVRLGIANGKTHLFVLQAQYLGLKTYTKQIDLSNALLDLGTIILEESKIDLKMSKMKPLE
jgi:hypothetical protein